MDEFCKSQFWERNLTWITTDPFFTPCFEETVFAWTPLGFLLVFALLDVHFALRSPSKNRLPWNILSLLKVALTLSLAIVALAYLIKVVTYDDSTTAHVLSASTRLLAYLVLLGLSVLHKQRGVRSSGVQFYFWLLSTICEGVLFRTAVRFYDSDVDSVMNFAYLMRFFLFPLVAVQLILSCWADGGWSRKVDGKDALYGFPCPEKSASHFSKLMYFWYDAMAWKGYRQPLSFKDLWDLNEVDKADVQIPKFNEHWKAATKAHADASGNPGQASVVSVLAKCYGWSFVTAGVMKLVQELLAFVSPEILKMLVAHVSKLSEEAPWKGYFYAAILIVTAFVQSIVGVQHNKRMLILGMRIRTVLSSAVYRKALVVSNNAKKESTAGEIVNLMSVDTQRLMDTAPFLHMAWTSVVVIALSVYFLYNTVGASVFAGLGVMILLIPFNGFISAKVRVLQMQQMVLKDNRVKLMSELLASMKVLKLYAWEPSFQDQITEIRGKEIKLLRKAALLNTATVFSFTCAPFLVALATYATYVLTDETHNLNAEKAFVSLSLLNIIRLPMTMLPMSIALIIQATVSVARLNKYLNSEEIDPDAVSHDSSAEDPVEIKNGKFSWTDESVTLHDINFRAKKGTLTAVVGTVGSGKTSLLSTLLGDLKKHTGSVNVNGSMAYVAQGAWIQNATLRDNILFNDHFDEKKYQKVIEACALGPDLQILDHGDETEIGEKGINLSGGQKQRVSLARAAYKESDVYLWDDALSAVDAHVGKHIFDKLIGPQGILREKTRVLVTHGISFLPQVDNIVVMKDGRVSEEGTFKELLAKKGSFAEFLKQHLGTNDSEEPDEALIEELEEIVGVEPERRNSTKIRRRSTQESLGNKKKVEEEVVAVASKAKLIEEEKSETGNIKLSVFTDYLKAAGYAMSSVGIFFLIVSSGIVTYSNIWLSDWSDQATIDEMTTGGKQVKSTTDKYLSVYGGLGAVQAVSYMVAFFAVALSTVNAATKLHERMLTRVMRAPMSYFDTTPLGRLVNRFAKDVDTTDNVVPLNFRATVTLILNVIASVVVISYSTPIILVFIAPCMVVYYFVQRFYVTTSRQLKRIESVTRSPIYSKFGETISGSSTIRAFAIQNEFIEESEKKINQNQQAYYPFIASSLWISVRLEFIGGLIIFAAAVFAMSSRDSISPAIVGLSITSALQMTQLLNFFVRVVSELESNIISVERMNELTDETPQEAAWVTNNRPSKEWPQNGAVEFVNYQARYREGLDLVLRGITCSFKPGEKIGIVGRTGAGKSSLTLALFRLVEPAGGEIFIDGQNVTGIGLHDLRSKITIIPQDPVLFSGNLRMNLDPFNYYSDDQVWRCLESAHLKSFISELPQGLLHEVAEEGQNFSVGQRQLLCLARALLRKTKILVLDEATAAVDLETDDLIQKTIRSEFATSTVITIAHRLNTILDSNRVVVLDKGKIIEFDTPANLLANKKSIFHGMAKDAGLV